MEAIQSIADSHIELLNCIIDLQEHAGISSHEGKKERLFKAIKEHTNVTKIIKELREAHQ